MNLDLKTKNRKEFHFFSSLPFQPSQGNGRPSIPSLSLLLACSARPAGGPAALLPHRPIAPRPSSSAPACYRTGPLLGASACSARLRPPHAPSPLFLSLRYWPRQSAGPTRRRAPARVLPFSLTALPAPPISHHHPLSFFPALLPFSAPPMARAQTASYRRRCSYKASRPRPFGKRPISPAPLPSTQHPRPMKPSRTPFPSPPFLCSRPTSHCHRRTPPSRAQTPSLTPLGAPP